MEPLSLPGEAPNEPVERLIHRLQAMGFNFEVKGDRLKVGAPKGAIDEVIKATIAARRAELVAALKRPSVSAAQRAAGTIGRMPRDGALPVSSAQRRLWFLDQMDPGHSQYNIGGAVRFRGMLDIDVLQGAIKALIARHESLRTRISERDGSPWLEILDSARAAIQVVDLSQTPLLSREAEGQRLSEAWLRKPFDMARGPLAGFLTVRLAPDNHLLVCCTHHAVSDGWSLAIAHREIYELYNAGLTGRDAVLPPLSVEYIDYAALEREEMGSENLAGHLAYWKRQLKGAPTLHELPTDRPRPAAQSFRGRHLIRYFDAGVIDALNSRSRKHEATLFMTMLAAWQVLLHRYSGQDDIVVGSPFANRNVPGLEDVIGCLVNNVVLRAQLGGNPRFSDFLAQVKETTLSAFDHQELPFDLLVEALNPERSTSHAPIFQVLFTLMSFPTWSAPPIGLSIEPVICESHTSRFDLAIEIGTVGFGEQKGKLCAAYEYASDLFDEETIARLHSHFERVLTAVAADPSCRIQDLSLVTPEDKRLLFEEWNDTDVAYDRTRCVHQLFEATAQAMPDTPAVTAGAVTLTYRELDKRANQLAHLLRERGVSGGSRVALCLDRTVDMPVAVLAVLKAGAVYVPLDPTHPVDRLRDTLENAEISCVITLGRFAPLCDASGDHLVFLDELQTELAAQRDTPPSVVVRPEDLAYVIYTSGSTGRPKGVEVEHRNVVNFLNAMQREPGLAATDTLLAVTTLAFDIAELEIWLPLSIGARVVIASHADVLDGEQLIALIEAHAISVLQATPATWRLLIEAGWTGKRGLKALCGGEALPLELAGLLTDRVGALWNLYGPTETTIWSTVGRVASPSGGIPIGHPIANTRVYVLDPGGRPAPIGAAGELCIAGEGVARGYRNRPELTAEKFVTITFPDGRAERVYRTGDLARFRGDGQLEFLGRRDHQVKIRGIRIELGEIETILATIAGVKECVVVAREDSPGDQRLVGYVTLASGASFDHKAARATLRTKLPEYMIPSIFTVLPTLPLTVNNKIDRMSLPAPQLPAPQVPGPGVSDLVEALMTPVQRRVAGIWCEILRLDRVGLNDNFFDVGGHSMLLVKLHARLKREFGMEITLVELFQWTTVALQADRLSSVAGSDDVLNRARARAVRQLHG